MIVFINEKRGFKGIFEGSRSLTYNADIPSYDEWRFGSLNVSVVVVIRYGYCLYSVQ